MVSVPFSCSFGLCIILVTQSEKQLFWQSYNLSSMISPPKAVWRQYQGVWNLHEFPFHKQSRTKSQSFTHRSYNNNRSMHPNLSYDFVKHDFPSKALKQHYIFSRWSSSCLEIIVLFLNSHSTYNHELSHNALSNTALITIVVWIIT